MTLKDLDKNIDTISLLEVYPMTTSYIVELKFKRRHYFSKHFPYKRTLVCILKESDLIPTITSLFFCNLIKTFTIRCCFSVPDENINPEKE